MFFRRRRSLGAVVLVGASFAAIVSTHGDRAEACSCAPPGASFLSPTGPAAPLNSHARVEVPSRYFSRKFVIRAHRGAVVPSTVAIYGGGSVATVDVTPTVPLAPSTRYEVAAVDATSHPSTLVIGTFVTGTTTDTTAPTLGQVHVRTNLNTGHVGGGMCSVRGPWLSFPASDAKDPGGEAAFLVWRVRPGAAFDPKSSPDALVAGDDGTVAIGRTSLCDPHDFDLSGAAIDLVVVAVDDAGNRSGPRRVHADLTRPSP